MITAPGSGQIWFDTVALPHRAKRSYDGLFCSSLQAYLTVGDSVVVKEYENCPPIIGKIIEIRNYHDFFGCNHPKLSKCKRMFLVMRYIVKEEVPNYESSWPPLPTTHKNYFHGMQEAAETNHVVHVSPDQILSVAFLIHESDVRSQLFGPVAGIADCYFIRFFAIPNYPDHPEEYYLEEYRYDDYLTFGPHTKTATETYTERILLSLCHDALLSRRMLCRSGITSSPNSSESVPKSKEAWHFVSRKIVPSMLSSKNVKTKTEMLHSDV